MLSPVKINNRSYRLQNNNLNSNSFALYDKSFNSSAVRNNISFGINFFKAAKKNKTVPQPLPKDLYFIRMKTYKKDEKWAEEMINLTCQISNEIRKKADFYDLILLIRRKLKLINHSNYFGTERILQGGFTILQTDRGGEYTEKYLKKLNSDGIYIPKSNNEYKDANVCRIIARTTNINDCINIKYGWNDNNKVSNLELAKKEYEKLKRKKSPTLDDINKSCATIQWLIVQECPYKRGNDSIANILTKSIYHAYGIEISPLKKDISLDFEAFYRDLDDYIKNYPTFFERFPKKINQPKKLSLLG